MKCVLKYIKWKSDFSHLAYAKCTQNSSKCIDSRFMQTVNDGALIILLNA